MKKFIVLYHMSAEAAAQAAKTPPEEMKKGMESWMEWSKKIGTGLVEFGTPLGNGQRMTKSGSVVPSDKEVAGYSVLQAESMDQAIEMLKGHPHLQWAEGCEIEVHESLPTPGM